MKEPLKSVFVSANAGSGKTYILVKRIIDLLISGVEPQKILCITYTKVAAQEMEERLLKKLQEEHKEYFAKFIQNGTKPIITTFHAFCQKVLSTFRVEAEVASAFDVPDDLELLQIKKEAVREILQSSNISQAKSINLSLKQFEDLCEEGILKQKTKFEKVLSNPNWKEQIYKKLNVEEFILQGTIEQKLSEMDQIFVEKVDINAIYAITKIQSSKKTINDAISKLNQFLETKDLFLLKDAFLNKQGEPRANVLKDEDMGDFASYYCDLLQNHDQAKEALTVAKTTEVILLIAWQLLDIFNKKYKQKGYISFDEMIDGVHELLLQKEDKDFVTFKMDGWFDHVLVDEAQDTNSKQWEIIFLMIKEFYSGHGSSQLDRTIFVVGDDKQSIYSFQGAEPQIFSAVEKDILSPDFFNGTKQSLAKSYRSSQAILDFVDMIFVKNEQFRSYITCDESFQGHEVLKDFEGQGRAEIFFLEKQNKEEDKNNDELWEFPWNQFRIKDEENCEANQIITKIDSIIKTDKIQPNEILLLVRNRDQNLLDKLENSALNFGYGISFNDGIKYSSSLPIMDFISFAKVCLLIQDEYSLSCLLKSPIFNCSEEDVFNLIKAKSKDDLLFDFVPQVIKEQINEIKSLSQNLSAYNFFNSLYNKYYKHYQENEILALEKLVELAKSQTFFLEEFIEYFETIKDQEFKIQASINENVLRVMTIHSAKGLEAEVVFLLNCHKDQTAGGSKSKFIFDNNLLFYSLKSSELPYIKEITQMQKQAEYAESLRLLYVAITRSKSQFYAISQKKFAKNSWTDAILASIPGEKIEYNIQPKQQSQTKPQTENQIIHLTHESLQVEFKQDERNLKTATSKIYSVKHKAVILGTQMHKLLELKPNFDKQNAIDFLISDEVTKEEAQMLVLEAVNVMQQHKWIFENGLSEVSLTFDGFNIQIDKLVFDEKTIHIIDFKRIEKEVTTDEITNQLTIYKTCIQKIYPNYKVRTYILWVKSANLLEVMVGDNGLEPSTSTMST